MAWCYLHYPVVRRELRSQGDQYSLYIYLMGSRLELLGVSQPSPDDVSSTYSRCSIDYPQIIHRLSIDHPQIIHRSKDHPQYINFSKQHYDTWLCRRLGHLPKTAITTDDAPTGANFFRLTQIQLLFYFLWKQENIASNIDFSAWFAIGFLQTSHHKSIATRLNRCLGPPNLWLSSIQLSTYPPHNQFAQL